MDSDEPFFDVTMRGYDKRQVDDFVARTNAQLADLAVARDQALATSADRAAQLAAHEAQIESLKARAAKKIETLNPAAVSDRIRDMLQLANEEAAQIAGPPRSRPSAWWARPGPTPRRSGVRRRPSSSGSPPARFSDRPRRTRSWPRLAPRPPSNWTRPEPKPPD